MNITQLTRTLDAAIEQHAFSGVIDIRRNDTSLYARAAGYADRSNKISNTLDTRFGTASGTKFLTALAIGKLIADQKLTLDTRLQECIRLDFPHYAPEITIRHLLTHTSGIPDYFDEEKISDFDSFFLSIPWYAMRGPRDFLAVFPDEPMKFAPGERFAYSNGGYILLGVVIEELTGMRYQEFVQQAIFSPLGMHQSGFFPLNQLPERTALGYIDTPTGWRTNVYNLPITGASDGGAYTTVGDVAILWNAFLNGAIIPRELVEIYCAPFVQTRPESTTYSGQGVWIATEAGQPRAVFLTGHDAGVSFRSRVEGDLQFTVISNTGQGAWPIVRLIEAAIIDL